MSTDWNYEGPVSFYWWYAFARPVISPVSYFNLAPGDSLVQTIYNLIESNDSAAASLLNLMNVRYIVYDNSIDNNTLLNVLTPQELLGYHNFLTTQKSINEVGQFGQLTVYEVSNTNETGLFYTSTNVKFVDSLADLQNQINQGYIESVVFANQTERQTLSSIDNSNATPQIQVDTLSGTQFRVTYSSKTTSVLVFSESYSALWTATNSSNKILSHIEVNEYANGWVLSPGNGTIMINYLPQKAQIVGDYVSGASFISVLVLFGFFRMKRNRMLGL